MCNVHEYICFSRMDPNFCIIEFYRVFYFFCFITTGTSLKLKKDRQTVVILSFDGFRYDYVERVNMRHFKEFARNGVKADSLKSAFVTKTLPNHFTMVTGLYEESHGIISNYMYDPKYAEYFDPVLSSKDSKWWSSAVPIWIENELQYLQDGNRTRKSATIYWPGSEATYNGHWQYYTEKKYNQNYTFKARVDKIIDLLLEPDPVNFIACYFEEPDYTSHKYGPDHENTSIVLQKVDGLLGYYINKLKKANLYTKINTIIVSDHGMMFVKKENVKTLTNYLHPDAYNIYSYGTFLLIQPKHGLLEEVYFNLTKVAHLKTYKKESIPSQWHYKTNRRITDIFSVADPGYYISPNENVTAEILSDFGDHGYDNNIKEMHGIFLAHGPAFKNGLNVGLVENIDLYVLMCEILELKPNPNNGSLPRVLGMLQEKTLFSIIKQNPTFVVILLSICGLFLIGVLCACSLSCFRSIKKSAKYAALYQKEVPLSEWSEDEEFFTRSN
ncbi:bis(5'-adenosyl)-triphosphatase enpp4 isoform X1 [Hydra vulgaris]|uniref:bis(5'-adenosyl)-triphosphatase enpp4 isoform X1 n=1 Tax=Hydra vulgaris TaxID=6087 RepID=UPI001F5ED613|nr:bis(5'-adenosyl)-triphosphatase enpp4 [Hydra vulgaris]